MDKFKVYDRSMLKNATRSINLESFEPTENLLTFNDEVQTAINKMQLEIDNRLLKSLLDFFNTDILRFTNMVRLGRVNIVKNEPLSLATRQPMPPRYDIFYYDELVLSLQEVQEQIPFKGGIKMIVTFEVIFEKEREQWKISI